MLDIHRKEAPSLGLNRLAADIAEWRDLQGFYQPVYIDGPIDPSLTQTEGVEGEPMLGMADINLGRLMLVTTELAEAAEAIRKGDWENYVEELADTFIRLLDITGTQGIDIEAAILDKMERNRRRPRKHGKKA
jgi:hypothetical protein